MFSVQVGVATNTHNYEMQRPAGCGLGRWSYYFWDNQLYCNSKIGKPLGWNVMRSRSHNQSQSREAQSQAQRAALVKQKKDQEEKAAAEARRGEFTLPTVGDVISCELDMDNHRLQFELNGHPLSPAIEGLPHGEGVTPVVFLRYKSTKSLATFVFVVVFPLFCFPSVCCCVTTLVCSANVTCARYGTAVSLLTDLSQPKADKAKREAEAKAITVSTKAAKEVTEMGNNVIEVTEKQAFLWSGALAKPN